MITEERVEELLGIVHAQLDAAEENWRAKGYALLAKAQESIKLATRMATDIPGFPEIDPNDPQVAEFIAVAIDMRDSTKHLMMIVNGPRVTQLQRIYYETSALLPCLARVVQYHHGAVTEYLGDGVLAFFLVPAADDRKADAIYSAYNAAKDSIAAVDRVVNQVIGQRYALPALEVGVGMALSKALITAIGLPGREHAKAFGECVFYATKLAKRRNAILCDSALYHRWPTAKGGSLQFTEDTISGQKGYRVHEQSMGQ